MDKIALSLREHAGLLRKMEQAGGVVTKPSYERMEKAAAAIELMHGRMCELIACGNAMRRALRSHSQHLGDHEIKTWDEVVAAATPDWAQPIVCRPASSEDAGQ